jgi:hypothetical protein
MLRGFAWGAVFACGAVLAAGQAGADDADFCEEKAAICVGKCDTDFAKGSAEHENCTAVCAQQQENCDRIMNTPNAGQPADSGTKQESGTVKQ